MERACYIAHHGIKGQKWGVRNYQNADGTLTEAGVKRYSKKAAKLYYKAKRNEIRRDRASTFSTYKKAQKRARKAEQKMDRVSAGLSKKSIDSGRNRIAKSRYLNFSAASVASSAATMAGLALIGSYNFAGIPIAIVSGYATGKSVTRLAYYAREKRQYRKSDGTTY